MNATTQSVPAPVTEIPLTRAAKEELLRQMYSRTHWIELIRLFSYQTLPMEQARKAIAPLAEQFGKEPVAAACEVLVEISMNGQAPVARLKPHVRRMAFQILGPEPSPDAATSTVASPPPPPSPHPEEDRPRPAVRKKSKKPSKALAPTAENAAPASSDGGSAIMQQYRAAKAKHPDMLLLFRMGDFYELFDQDAEKAHKLLGLTLTTRDRTLTMAGFPHHQLEVYLHKLLHEGQRVAICEVVEESLARGPIQREVTRVVTPGTMDEEKEPTMVQAGKPDEDTGNGTDRPVRQPRYHVLKQYEAWLNEAGLAFVAVEDVQRTTPAVAPFVSALDFIVLRGDEKLLVTVRPHLQAKHIKAIGELQNLFGSEYRPVRVWPSEGPNGWTWPDQSIAVATAATTTETASKPRPKRSRAKQT